MNFYINLHNFACLHLPTCADKNHQPQRITFKPHLLWRVWICETVFVSHWLNWIRYGLQATVANDSRSWAEHCIHSKTTQHQKTRSAHTGKFRCHLGHFVVCFSSLGLILESLRCKVFLPVMGYLLKAKTSVGCPLLPGPWASKGATSPWQLRPPIKKHPPTQRKRRRGEGARKWAQPPSKNPTETEC